jgi:hypothetical protein
MKRFLLFALALPTASLAGQVSAFRYDPGRVPVGTVYHYLKTNIDGTHPEHIVQYVAAPDRMEVYKFQAPGTRASLVTAWMDWEIFSAIRLETHQVWKDSTRKIATLAYDPAAREVAVEVFGRTERTAIPSLPFHVYNFDLGSLNLALPHLRNPNDRFTVELADPTYKEQPVFRDRGPVEVGYIEDATRDGQACRVYRIDGPGLDHKGGTLWVRKVDGFAQDIEIALPDNPSWSSFKLHLERRERMTPAEWEAFRQAHFTR